MAQYTPNFNLYEPDSTDDFADFRAEFNNNMDIIDQNLGGGGGSGGHTIIDENGNSLPQESGLQFTGNVNVSDDSGNGRTVVDILGGGGSNLILDAQIYSDNEKVVGVWRDNKPLYQRTIYIPSLPNATEVSYPHNISNLDKVVEIFGIAYNSSGYSIPIIFANPTYVSQVTAYTSATDIYVGTGMDRTSFVGYITLRYTKTTDVAGSGGYEAYGFSPVIYSDVERYIGVWRDNKPLYEKTFSLGALPNNSIKTVAHSIANVDLIFVADSFFQTGAGASSYLNFTNDSTAGQVEILVDRTNFEIWAGSNRSSWNGYATVRYTKTTDVAGSGDYNTYGVPTVHYDTNEQVIGTWITGKPLYEITVEVNSVNYNDWTDVFSLADADIKGYDSRTSYAQLNNGERVQLDWFVTTSIYNRSIITNSGTKFRVETHGNNYSKIVATIQYTKTTD